MAKDANLVGGRGKCSPVAIETNTRQTDRQIDSQTDRQAHAGR
jgi:hypothetical protein